MAGRNRKCCLLDRCFDRYEGPGVEDLLISCSDNLAGFTQGIRSIFPEAATQICVAHQIRQSSRYVVYKDKKAFTTDLKAIYNASNREVAAVALDQLEQNWGSKYPYAIKSWRANWEELTVFLTSHWRSARSFTPPT
jgi:putative transposase